MTTDAGSGFDNQAAGRDAGDDRLEEESRHLIGEDADDSALEEDRERQQVEDQVNDAFWGPREGVRAVQGARPRGRERM
jgi:hypothetical protein